MSRRRIGSSRKSTAAPSYQPGNTSRQRITLHITWSVRPCRPAMWSIALAPIGTGTRLRKPTPHVLTSRV
jgi:hypothetical protein